MAPRLQSLRNKWQRFSYIAGAFVLKRNVLSCSQWSVRRRELYKPAIIPPFFSLTFLKQAFFTLSSEDIAFKTSSRICCSALKSPVCGWPSCARRSKTVPAVSCTQHPALTLPFFGTASHCWLLFSSRLTPWAAFLQYCCRATYSPFSLCAFDFLLLSVALCTFLYWVVDFLQFSEIILNSQSIRQTVCILSQLDDVCRFYEYSLFPRHRLLMKILHKMVSTQMLERPCLKTPLSMTESNWQLFLKVSC